MLNKHPFDWIGHFGLHFIVAFVFGWKVACTAAITIELTQLEAKIRQPWWDYAIDLMADGIGIVSGLLLAHWFRGFPIW